MRRAVRRILAPVLAIASAWIAPPSSQAPLDRLLDDAFRASYNLDHDEALTLARRAVALAPDEPVAHRTLAAVLWLRILYLRGALTVDSYLGSVTKSQRSLPKAPPELEVEFKRELALAASLAEARLARNARDVQARADAGSAYALQASYTASVEGSLMAAFRTAKRAYDAHEAVLEREPQRAGSSVVVGTYRYMVAGLSLPTRLFAYIAGFGGGKERGISMIEGARRDPDAHVEATVTLLLIYTKEKRHSEAAALMRALAAEFPRNRLLVLEEGAALLRAGRAADADAVLSRGLEAFERDTRVKSPGERALWLYKRGATRVVLKRPAEAAADLRLALASQPIEWVRGRLHLELGKLADLAGRRSDALTEYSRAKAIGETNNDPLGAGEATRLLRRPFALTGGRLDPS
jgi:tetratricopeptide (TPR) repeat protein